MNKLREHLQNHKSIVWIILLSYIAFNGCVVFPFFNELFPLDNGKVRMVITCYGIIGMCFSGLLNKGKELVVITLSLLFTVIGLMLRYLLEYGEVSNEINFIPINIALYLVIIPIYCMVVYWGIYKWCAK